MDTMSRNSAQDGETCLEIPSTPSPNAKISHLPSSEHHENDPDIHLNANITAQSKPLHMLNSIFRKSGIENQSNLPVLAADHPLMIKYQKDLKEHFLKLHQETDEQLHELNIALRDQRVENDNIGIRNSDLQKKMTNYEKLISSFNSEIENITKEKNSLLKEATLTKEQHKTTYDLYQKEKKKEQKFQKQVDDLSLQIVQLNQLQLDSVCDSTTVKQAAEKTGKLKENLAVEKLRQDIYVEQLKTQKYNFCDKIKFYEAQNSIKKQEIADMRKVIIDADIDVQNVHTEKLKLLRQWKNSIEALEERDKMFHTFQEKLKNHKDKVMVLKVEEANKKKLLRKEFEGNEQLTLRLLKIDADIKYLKNVSEESKTHQLQLEEKHAFYEKIVHNMNLEQENLKRMKQLKEKQLLHKSQILKKLCSAFHELENEHLKALHEKVIQTKSTKQTEKLIAATREKIQNLEVKQKLKEGEDAKVKLRILNIQAHLNSIDEEVNRIEEEVKEQDKSVSQSETEIDKNHAVIEKRQKVLADLNKKLMDLVSRAGGKELGPTEREIANYKKNIIDLDLERKKLEQEWLRLQKDLMKLLNEINDITNESELLRTREAIYEEKKIRMEADIAKEEHEISELNRSIAQIKMDIARIAMLLYKEKELEAKIQYDTKTFKDDFYQTLKEAQLEFSRKENEVECLRKARKQMLLELTKTEQNVLMWEEKVRLADEAKKLLKSEEFVMQIENLINGNKRLKNKCEKIKKIEDILVKELEKAAFQYANLYIKGDNGLLKSDNKPSKPFFTTKIERLKKKIKEDKKKLEDSKQEVEIKQKEVIKLNQEEEKQEAEVKKLMDTIYNTDCEIEKRQQEKMQNIIKLSYKQKKNKLLQLLNEKKYVRAIRNSELREAEVTHLKENFLSLKDIAEKFIMTYPNLKPNLIKILDYIIVGLDM